MRMYGVYMDTAEPAALQDVFSICKHNKPALIICRMVSTRDKDRGGDTLIFGNQEQIQEQIYKGAAFWVTAAASRGIAFHHSVHKTVGKCKALM